jgi:hypothetical protein
MEVSDQIHDPGRFILRGKIPLCVLNSRLGGPEAVLNIIDKRNIAFLCRELNPDTPNKYFTLNFHTADSTSWCPSPETCALCLAMYLMETENARGRVAWNSQQSKNLYFENLALNIFEFIISATIRSLMLFSDFRRLKIVPRSRETFRGRLHFHVLEAIQIGLAE